MYNSDVGKTTGTKMTTASAGTYTGATKPETYPTT